MKISTSVHVRTNLFYLYLVMGTELSTNQQKLSVESIGYVEFIIKSIVHFIIICKFCAIHLYKLKSHIFFFFSGGPDVKQSLACTAYSHSILKIRLLTALPGKLTFFVSTESCPK